MKKMKRGLIGVALASAIGLGSHNASALSCSSALEASSAVLQVFEFGTTGIPIAGTALDLINVFSCASPVELTPEDVGDIVDAKLERDAVALASKNIAQINENIQVFYSDLARKYSDQEISFQDLKGDQIDFVIGNVSAISRDIVKAINALMVQLQKKRDSRLVYHAESIIILANYYLSMVKIIQSTIPGDGRIIDAAETIRDNIAPLKAESNRLREFNYSVVNTKVATHKPPRTEMFLVRNGEEVFKKEKVFQCDSSMYNICDIRSERAGIELLREKIKVFQQSSDKQNQHFELLEAQANALLQDTSTDVSKVKVSRPPEQVLLANNHPDAYGRCLFMETNAVLPDSGAVINGSTRLRDCDPLSARQRWVLENNGQIRSSIGPLCLEATNDDNKVYVKKCSSDKKTQRWDRFEDTFTVRINGKRRCLSPRADKIDAIDHTLRHAQCGPMFVKNDWLAFSPMENGAVTTNKEGKTQKPLVIPESKRLCLHSRINQQSRPSLAKCDRYSSLRLWAENKKGLLLPLDNYQAVLAPTQYNKPLKIVSKNESTFKGFKRTLVDSLDGYSIYFAKSKSDLFLIPSAAKKEEKVFLDLLPYSDQLPLDTIASEIEYYDVPPAEHATWRHNNGGRFLDNN